MKIVAKCSALVSLSYQVHVKLCDPIPLNDRILNCLRASENDV